ncbi:MAG: hypothetical protein A2Z83_02325 [Omnitrophica bacterium GWA2_52_8]|nr:MAG: hypothetical protein A2Z83_02325 [Omnitrophica bacterium GWA2_52_8]
MGGKMKKQLSQTRLVDTIGKTPLLKLEKILSGKDFGKTEVYAKAEWFNPGGSVKDRPAYRMVREGLASGQFRSGQKLIDSTSGNTGIAYAMLGAAMGFPVTLVVPDNISAEKKTILRAYGAELVFSPGLEGSDGARRLVRRVVEAYPGDYFCPDQYSNAANWKAHFETTGPEIWDQTGGRVTHFIAGLGTSGTVMGVGRYLKQRNPEIQIIALQPEPFHGIEGWKNMESSDKVAIYDPEIYDRKITVPTEPAYHWAQELALKEGMLVSASSGGVYYGLMQVLPEIEKGVVVLLFADSGDRYLSPQYFLPEKEAATGRTENAAGLSEAALHEIKKHAEKEYPNEGCGLILGPDAGAAGAYRFRSCVNAQDLYHKQDAGLFPRTSRTAYFIAPGELLAVQKELRAAHEKIRIIYHSHPDAGAYFSEEDQRMAAPDGDPAYPGVKHLVISVQKGKAGDWQVYEWSSGERKFVPMKGSSQK